MAGENRRVYFYDGAWREYPELHDDYGITLTPSTPITVYDDSLTGYPAWTEKSTGLIWVVKDTQWYSPNELPYWIKLDTQFKVYLIDEAKYFDQYKHRDGTVLYNYNGALQTFDYMHNGYGITLTPSRVYLVQDGFIKCWYNKDITDLPYWDVDTVQWLPEPPSHAGGGGIDDVGSTGTFLYNSVTGDPTHYGALVAGSRLQPMCINYPDSGEVSCTRHNIMLTGTWKILTETARSAVDNKCIVTAVKVSDDNEYSNYVESDSPVSNEPDASPAPLNSPLNNAHSGNVTEIIEYDL